MESSGSSTSNFFEEYATSIQSKHVNKSARRYSRIKRACDILFSILTLPVAIFLVFLFFIFIKLESPGPVFFKQKRVGLHGAYFNIIKLRSMHVNAEANGAVWAQVNDPRITKVGKFIRKTRIDELPQIINVLKGDMSIVGPRPERPVFTAEFETLHPNFTERLFVKPGITGWAQVNGGYNISPKEKLDLDLYYIANKSILLDMFIIFKTIKVVFTGHGAR